MFWWAFSSREKNVQIIRSLFCSMYYFRVLCSFWRWKSKWCTEPWQKSEYKMVRIQLLFTLWTACARQFAPPHPPYNGGADGTRPSRGNGKRLKVVYNIIVSKWDVSISMTLRKKLVAVYQGWHVLINISPDIYVRTNSELLGSELYGCGLTFGQKRFVAAPWRALLARALYQP